MSADGERLDRLAQLAYERLGIHVGRGAVASALERYAECFGADVGDLGTDKAAFREFIAAVTVQHSWLFRDRQQLELACDLLAADRRSGRRAIWVPACATGEDVYSLLALSNARGVEALALGTDVHEPAIEHARRGVFGESSSRHVPPEFAEVLNLRSGTTRASELLRRNAGFQLRNLLEEPPRSQRPDGLWDLIVCRNVLIYFSTESATKALERMLSALAPGGTLVVGASDIVTELPRGLEPREYGGRIVFQHAAKGARRTPQLPELPAAARVEVARAGAGIAGPNAPVRAASAGATAQGPARAASAGATAQGPARAAIVASNDTAIVASNDTAIVASNGTAIVASNDASLVASNDASLVAGALARGIELYLAGDPQAALNEFRTALYLEPELWPASYYSALCWETMGRSDEARRAYECTCSGLELARPTPEVPGHDLSFLRRDVARIAYQRAGRRSR
ncbi:MAG TPA: CheR family methyltransferase [Polyangiaceae bacterium]|nr:CheR family methyltransferase [Polyangiaceae bacterium]